MTNSTLSPTDETVTADIYISVHSVSLLQHTSIIRIVLQFINILCVGRDIRGETFGGGSFAKLAT